LASFRPVFLIYSCDVMEAGCPDLPPAGQLAGVGMGVFAHSAAAGNRGLNTHPPGGNSETRTILEFSWRTGYVVDGGDWCKFGAKIFDFGWKY
jgi:hypothetical protein